MMPSCMTDFVVCIIAAQFDNVYEGDARLVNGTTASEGILQVRNQWMV